MRLGIVLLVCLFSVAPFLRAQDYSDPVISKDSFPGRSEFTLFKHHWLDVGVGIGIDYGGVVGVKLDFNPIPYLGVFFSGGWYMTSLAWNAGIIGRVLPANDKYRFRPIAKVMYGVNSAVIVVGKESYNAIYYGLTAGIGIECRFGKKRLDGFNLEVNYPFRSPDFYSRYNEVRDDPDVVIRNKPLPITISIGYHHEFKKL